MGKSSGQDTIRVFVSATAEDLKHHRLAVREAIMRLGRAWKPICMEDFGARPSPAVDACLAELRRCSALVVVVAHRYGWVPGAHDGGDGRRSITWLEVQAAQQKGIPIFAFLVDPEYGWPHAAEEARLREATSDEEILEVGRSVRALEEFRSTLSDQVVRDTFTTADDLARTVSASLAQWWQDDQRDDSHPGQSSPRESWPHELAVELGGYLRSAVSAYEHITLAGFEKKLRVPIQLEDMYVPLHASMDTRLAGITRAGSAEEMESELRESSQVPLTEAFERAEAQGGRRGLVILGDPGAGKTTHLKRLLLWLIRQGPDAIGLPHGMVPVFLPMRELRNLNAGLDTLLQTQLDGNPHLNVSEGFAGALLERGNLLFLLDGLDEIPDVRERQRALEWIEKALEAHTDSRFVVTCRYAGYRALADQFSGRFLELHLRPLNQEQASSFIHNWFRIVETGIGQPESVAVEKAEELIARLKEPDFRSARVFELTRNPLLLTAICLVHRDRGALPHRRADLYEECVNVLLEGWRRKIGLGLDAKMAKRVLQPAAYWLHGEQGRTRATGKELEPVIAPTLAQVGDVQLTASSFLATVRDGSGLLTGWGEDSYGFMHLGFQEYLAARHIGNRYVAEPALLVELAQRFGDTWWREVILLLLALENPPLFEPLMEQVTNLQAFAAHDVLVQACLEDASEVSLAPFWKLVDKAPGRSKELWLRQLAAIRVLQAQAPAALAGMRRKLARHPMPEIKALFGAEQAAQPETLLADQGGYELLLIPGGRFTMGSPMRERERATAEHKQQHDNEVNHYRESEGPEHDVEVPAFALGRLPVTNEEYGRYLKANPEALEPAFWGDQQYNQPRQPVVGVSWDEAQAYCTWARLRLPTEAEWEYACRAGAPTAFWSGDEEPDLDRIGWFSGNSQGRLHPVGEKAASPFGLHDMHGNVFEWCQDTWHDSYEGAPADGSAWEAAGSVYRVVRGGGFGAPAWYARSACRNRFHPSFRSRDLGFRPARVITE